MIDTYINMHLAVLELPIYLSVNRLQLCCMYLFCIEVKLHKVFHISECKTQDPVLMKEVQLFEPSVLKNAPPPKKNLRLVSLVV